MARYEGRHRNAPAPSTAPSSKRAASSTRTGRPHRERTAHASDAPPVVPQAPRRAAPTDTSATIRPATKPTTGATTRRSSRHETPSRARRIGRPVLAGVLALGLGASGFAYAKATNLLGADAAAFVVGSGVVAQTDELARATTVDTTYRAAASVSRNERRTAIAATGLRTAKELEVKKKKEAARKAEEAREAAEKAERERERQRAIDNAKEDPQAAARVLMADHGWTSDAQYNCLVNLWTGESDWRWWAENSSSGAYGIPQSLPASKMAMFGSDYRTNPITQIKWGLWYIEMSYGNPCNAWSTWQARSPHWY
jgi:hypothetical protein